MGMKSGYTYAGPTNKLAGPDPQSGRQARKASVRAAKLAWYLKGPESALNGSSH